jgi:polar amino acid transport system substrate-binding protein
MDLSFEFWFCPLSLCIIYHSRMVMRYINLAVLTVSTLVGLCLSGCKELAETPANAPLKVGMDLSYPPFETINSSGEPEGVSVDLAQALGSYLGRPAVVENMSFIGLIPALKSGKIDLIISSMSDTPERRKSIAFSNPYVTTVGLCILAGKDSAIASASDLDAPDRTVVVRQGTTGQLWAQANLAKARVVTLEKESAAVMEVVQGKADAFIYDQISVWQYNRQYPEATVALLEPVKPEQWAIGLRLQDAGLKARVNEFLQKFREEGGFARLGSKYLSEQKADFERRGVAFSF